LLLLSLEGSRSWEPSPLQALLCIRLAACLEACRELSGPPAAALAPSRDESCVCLAAQGCGAAVGRVAEGKKGMRVGGKRGVSGWEIRSLLCKSSVI